GRRVLPTPGPAETRRQRNSPAAACRRSCSSSTSSADLPRSGVAQGIARLCAGRERANNLTRSGTNAAVANRVESPNLLGRQEGDESMKLRKRSAGTAVLAASVVLLVAVTVPLALGGSV